MAPPLLHILQRVVSTTADVRPFLLLCIVVSCVAGDIVEGQYTVITASDTFPPSSFLHVVTTEALSNTTTVNVWLGSDETFLLVDKSKKLLHLPAQFKAEAYPYVGKKCNFAATVKLSALFPLVPTTHVYWTQPTVNPSPSASTTRGASAVFWKFTNPNGAVLNKNVTRFCYRFIKLGSSDKTGRPAILDEEVLTEAAAHDAPATEIAEIRPTKQAEVQNNQNFYPAVNDATSTPVVVLVFHSRAPGFTPSIVCTVVILLSVSIALWLAV